MLSLRSLCRHSSCYERLWHVRLTVLPAEVVQQVVAKTDGVRLFVEELTKMMLESGPLWEEADHNELAGPLPSLAIPTTLHDSLMARLDRLAAVKQVAQLGATIGRSFSYELVRAVSSLDDIILQRTLAHLAQAIPYWQRAGQRAIQRSAHLEAISHLTQSSYGSKAGAAI
jgi:predicted ATPase